MPAHNSFSYGSDVVLVYSEFSGPQRQFMDPLYMPNGYVYIHTYEAEMDKSVLYGERILPFEMSLDHNIDIDTKEDFASAEEIIAKGFNR